MLPLSSVNKLQDLLKNLLLQKIGTVSECLASFIIIVLIIFYNEGCICLYSSGCADILLEGVCFRGNESGV